MTTRPLHLGILLAIVTSTACCKHATNTTITTDKGTKIPLVPTQTMLEVVQDINRNNNQLPTLWASHYCDATVVDSKGREQFVNVTGAVLYRRPLGFTLVGKKDLIGDVFTIGSNDQYYWMKLLEPDPSRLWYGEHKNVGKPCVSKIPIQPNLVMEILGIGTIGTDFTQMPAPVMRFNPDADAYMFNWIAPTGGQGKGPARLVAQREIWYDRQTKLPRRVILFDENGRPVLRAVLGDHRPVNPDGEDEPQTTPQDKWPRVATDYQLLFPENGSKLRLKLSDVVLSKGPVPAKRGIVFPGTTPDEAGVLEVIKLDKDCTD